MLLQVLGVARDASAAEVKATFRSLARVWHPDRVGGLPQAERLRAEARFKEINLANEVLADRAKRRRYDEGAASVSDLVAGFWSRFVSRREQKRVRRGADEREQ